MGAGTLWRPDAHSRGVYTAPSPIGARPASSGTSAPENSNAPPRAPSPCRSASLCVAARRRAACAAARGYAVFAPDLVRILQAGKHATARRLSATETPACGPCSEPRGVASGVRAWQALFCLVRAACRAPRARPPDFGLTLRHHSQRQRLHAAQQTSLPASVPAAPSAAGSVPETTRVCSCCASPAR